MKRRTFLTATAASLAGGALMPWTRRQGMAAEATPRQPFQLHYAPHPNMFQHSAGKDLIDQIQFTADVGFTAWEDNGMRKRDPQLQEKIGATLADRGMKMGVFVAHGSIGKLTFAVKDQAVWDAVLSDIRDSVAVAKRCGATWMTVVPGNVDERGGGRLAPGYQTANVVDLLRRCAEILEPHGLVMVLEPLNWYANHGGVFLRYADQAYAVCQAVNSPSCKILFDIYHQQISEGNLIPNIDAAWDEIGYFQCGDNPGRKEPGTGEINYRNVFRHIATRSTAPIIGMEHGIAGKGQEGEEALIQAYREADAFQLPGA
jgi:hydroxypyruvate isomerase